MGGVGGVVEAPLEPETGAAPAVVQARPFALGKVRVSGDRPRRPDRVRARQGVVVGVRLEPAEEGAEGEERPQPDHREGNSDSLCCVHGNTVADRGIAHARWYPFSGVGQFVGARLSEGQSHEGVGHPAGAPAVERLQHGADVVAALLRTLAWHQVNLHGITIASPPIAHAR